jgi:hypothetical protein
MAAVPRAMLVAFFGALAGAPAMAVPAHAGSFSGAAGGIVLPAPVGNVDPLAAPQLKLRPDRLRTSTVPGHVNDHEDVRVALGPTGVPTSVVDTQRLVIHGAGNYIVRELGPAREAVGLGGTVPPVLELGTVVWQGFSPGTRALSARLTLDPGIEAARLPLSVRFDFHDAAGHVRPLTPGSAAPTAGTVTVTLTNNTASNRIVATGVGEPDALASALDELRRAASRPGAAVPPTAGDGLPKRLAGRTTGALSLNVVAPLRVTGTITAPGGTAAISGPGLSPAPGGMVVAGTLSGLAGFTIKVARGDRIGMTLDVRPWVDARALSPPAPAHTWKEWAADAPSSSAVADATQTLVTNAAAAARAAEYSPYLQADAPGPDLSTFTYVVAPPPLAFAVTEHIQPRPGGIAAAAVAVLAILGNAVLLRRRL